MIQKKSGTLLKQEGGDHYKKLPIEPWQIIDANGLNYYEGNVVKYVMRRKADRIGDLKKAIHYLEHLIELEEIKQCKSSNHTSSSKTK